MSIIASFQQLCCCWSIFLMSAVEGHNWSCYWVCSPKSIATTYRGSNAISYMPKVQNRTTEADRDSEQSPKSHSFKYSSLFVFSHRSKCWSFWRSFIQLPFPAGTSLKIFRWFHIKCATISPQRQHTEFTFSCNEQVSEMQAEYFPPKEDVILQHDAPSDLYILVSGSVVSHTFFF